VKSEESHGSPFKAINWTLDTLLSLAFLGLILTWLWFVLINELRVEWTVNPQYGYGWVVPFLSVFLVWRRMMLGGANFPGKDETMKVRLFNLQLSSSGCCILVVICALLYAPTRMIEAANPGWRLIDWTLAFEVVGLTLLFIRLTLGSDRASLVIFPICYFLVAVPWPTPLEQSVIQGLTRMDTNFTAELLGWIGIPALPHGNVIQVASGTVGIDGACSGIRSFQATLMLSLFLGEFQRLNNARRAILCFTGFALSFVFNLIRMSLLVSVAEYKGVNAIAAWHDPAGVTILVACFFCLLGMSVLFSQRGQKRLSLSPNANFQFPVFDYRRLIISIGVWILFTETSVQAWYCWHEAQLPRAIQWAVKFPMDNPTFRALSLPERTREILRYDEGNGATWQEGGSIWQVVFLKWNPGRTAVHLAQNHTPEICMTAAGYQLNSISSQQRFNVHGLQMPFLAYRITNTPRPFYVFYCLWDDRANTQTNMTMGLTYGNRLAPVIAGLRNPGQRSIEISVTGPDDIPTAEYALKTELEKLVVIQ
jgi:exosortase